MRSIIERLAPVYSIFEEEEGTTIRSDTGIGYPHLQGYLALKLRTTRAKLKGTIGLNEIHLEVRGVHSTHEHAKGYCDKRAGTEYCDGTYRDGPWTFGSDADLATRPRERSDLLRAATMVQERTSSMKDVSDAFPGTYVQYWRGLMALRLVGIVAYAGPRDVTWIYGAAGCGKTREAYRLAPGLYNLFSVDNPVWFEQYDGESVLLIDNITPNFPWAMLMKVLDRYPITVPVKGSSVNAAWKSVIITCINSPKMFCSSYTVGQDWELGRRLTRILDASNDLLRMNFDETIRTESPISSGWTEYRPQPMQVTTSSENSLSS